MNNISAVIKPEVFCSVEKVKDRLLIPTLNQLLDKLLFKKSTFIQTIDCLRSQGFLHNN